MFFLHAAQIASIFEFSDFANTHSRWGVFLTVTILQTGRHVIKRLVLGYNKQCKFFFLGGDVGL